MLTLAEILQAAQVAAMAAALVRLFEDGQLLAAWGRWLDRIRWEWPNLYKAAGGCPRCFTGQMALWLGVFIVGLGPFELVAFILITIFFGELIARYG